MINYIKLIIISSLALTSQTDLGICDFSHSHEILVVTLDSIQVSSFCHLNPIHSNLSLIKPFLLKAFQLFSMKNCQFLHQFGEASIFSKLLPCSSLSAHKAQFITWKYRIQLLEALELNDLLDFVALIETLLVFTATHQSSIFN